MLIDDGLLMVAGPSTPNVLRERSEVLDTSNVDDWQEVKRKNRPSHRERNEEKEKTDATAQKDTIQFDIQREELIFQYDESETLLLGRQNAFSEWSVQS
jgi:hypothetical protein